MRCSNDSRKKLHCPPALQQYFIPLAIGIAYSYITSARPL